MFGLAHKRLGRNDVEEGRSARLPRLHHVTIQVPPPLVVPSLEFYKSILGLDSVGSPIQKTTWFEQGIHLYWGNEAYYEPIEPGPHHFALVLGSRYADVVASCKKLGMFLEEGTPYWGSPRCYVKDPGGNRIELMERAP